MGSLAQPGQPAEQVEVAGEGAGDPGRKTLTATSRLRSLPQNGPARSRPRATGFRRTRQTGVRASRELGLDQGARLAPGKGRQAILQQRQILGDLVAQEIGAGRQDLAELDEARPELGEGGGQPLARAAVWGATRRCRRRRAPT